MRVLSRKKVREYGEANAQAKEEVAIWFAKMELGEWHNLNEVKEDILSVDYIGNDRYVFNVKGNHYRVIVMLFFATQRIYIHDILTHAEYTKLSKKDILTSKP
ncbi:MAG: type II toxin-antitoxin system HigB family toxin [Hymenobacter sp.]|nr:MAG: type II toxin-antitoxin system HigB family toxin [Hymenobacter sp.]